MSHQVKACPECDSSDITYRTNRFETVQLGDEAWRCDNCRATFDEAVTRESNDPIPHTVGGISAAGRAAIAYGKEGDRA